jgi:hypothetical protein
LLSQDLLLLLLLLLLNHGGSIFVFGWPVTRNERELWLGWWIGVCVCAREIVWSSSGSEGGDLYGGLVVEDDGGSRCRFRVYLHYLVPQAFFWGVGGFAAGFDDVSRELAAAISA